MAYLGAFPAKVKVVEDAAEETLLLWACACKAERVCVAGLVAVEAGRMWAAAAHHAGAFFGEHTRRNWGGHVGQWRGACEAAGACCRHAWLAIEGQEMCRARSWLWSHRRRCSTLGRHRHNDRHEDRLRLLQKNVDENSHSLSKTGACVRELTWGDKLDKDIVDPLPDFVLASDVIYIENVVPELLQTLRSLTGPNATVLLSDELRNDAVLECFFKLALEDFLIGRVLEADLHPDFCSPRVATYVLVKKPDTRLIDDNPWIRR